MYMRLMKLCGLVLLLSQASACTSVGGRNVDFIEGKPANDMDSTTIELCRPSFYYASQKWAGLFVDGAPVANIGSGDRYRISIPRKDELVVGVAIPDSEDFYSSATKPHMTLSITDMTDDVFVLLQTRRGSSMGEVVGAVLFGGTVHSDWEVSRVVEALYTAKCGDLESLSLTHKTLMTLDNALIKVPYSVEAN